jgi:CDP-glycerol glycerophosphotransferase
MARPTGERIERIIERVRKAAHYEQIAWSRAAKIIEGQILYETFAGNGMVDNPEAIFSALLAAPDMQHMRHVWVLRDLETYRSTVERYRGDSRVRFVSYESARYFDALSRSQYLINNATFPSQFGKREGQIYINTWHGTPIKHMGYHIPGGGPATRNIVRNFVSADFLLSGNDFMTQHFYESAYKLRGIYRGQIIQEGSPRVDRQFMTDEERATLKAHLACRGVAIHSNRRVVLYAPTFRGSFYSPVNDAAQLLNRVRMLNQRIDNDRYQVLLKVHQRIYEFALAQPELRNLLIPNDVPTNSMLGATDVLITDYSSIFFDFLTTGRPLLFYMPDEEHYLETRGLYIPANQLPGPVARSVDELVKQLNSLLTGDHNDPLVSHAEAYASARKRYCSRDDGRVAERIVDIVFRSRAEGYDVRGNFSDGRTSILIYLGGMRTNGITQSALSLLDNIDHERFDVSACYKHSLNPDCRRNEDSVNPNVRLFPWFGGINGSKLFSFGRHIMLSKGMDSITTRQRRSQTRLFREEWVRCFGNSTFHHIVDFSGYNPYVVCVLLEGRANTHSIFLHNDLVADSQREVSGERPHERNLRSVFTTYRSFDNLVSVSAALSDINCTKLTEYASPEKFVSAMNTINHERILRMAFGMRNEGSSPQDSAFTCESRLPEGEATALVNLDNLSSAIDQLMERYQLCDIMDEVHRKDTLRRLVPSIPGMTTFVSAGRLSPEKNHARLIRAFDIVHRDNPNTRLVIIGGGPLEAQLTALIAELGLVNEVTLAGWQHNPYAIMANSDCFVLSSDYEGQPMVLLEAMVLGLPVVTTDFSAVCSALPQGYGRVVAQDADSLAEGMRAYLSGQVHAQHFDYAEHNRNAVRQFCEAIGVITPSVCSGNAAGAMRPDVHGRASTANACRAGPPPKTAEVQIELPT